MDQTPLGKRFLLLLFILCVETESLSISRRLQKTPCRPARPVSCLRSSDSINGSGEYDSVSDTEKKPRDSEERFEADVTEVLRDLRPFAYDPTVPRLFTRHRLSFTSYWNLDDWTRHNSRWRFVRYIKDFPDSVLLRRVMPQLSVLIIWSLISVMIRARSTLFDKIGVPLASLSLVSTFVAALQTLRSNQGLSRLAMGREAMGRSVLLTRDTAMLFATYIYPKDKILGLKAARLLSLFGWSLKAHIRNTNALDVLRVLLPTTMNASYGYVAYQRKRPVALLALLRQIMAEMAERKAITTTEHRLIEDNIRGLDNVIMTAEKIRATPIPTVYSGHATRLMMFYLFFLPLALLGSQLSGGATVFVTSVVGFAMLGLDEISHIFEQPFRFMPLYQLAKVSMLDVADAFMCQPPPLSSDGCESAEELVDKPNPTYWKYVKEALPYGPNDKTT